MPDNNNDDIENNENDENGNLPVKTKVSCWNYCCRIIGCCDMVSNGDEPPNLRQGVLTNRILTDLPWLIACVLFSFMCVTFIWVPAMSNSDYTRFQGSSDYLKNTCGVSPGVETKKYAAWPDLMQYDIKICVTDCTATQNAVFSGGYTSTKTVFWCVPDSNTPQYQQWFDKFTDNRFMRYMMDMYDYYDVPMYAIAFTFGFLIIFFLFVWCCLGIIFRMLYVGILAGTLVGAYSFMKDGPTADEASYYTGVGILCVGLTLWFALMCCWSSLSAVITTMQKASEALIKMPAILFFPLFTMVIMLGIILAWYIVVLSMFSSDEYTITAMPSSTYISQAIDLLYPAGVEKNNYYVNDYNVDIQNTFWIHLFWMLWGLKFIEYFQFLIVSGCVADWFLDENLVDNPDENEELKKSNCMRLFRSFKRTLIYHLGTIAFASALIAAIQTIEAILLYLKKTIGDDTTNPFAKAILNATMAVIKCVECIMDRCNKSTLVVVAVLGLPFCAGCGSALKMFFQNMALMSLGTGMIMLLCLLSNFVIAALSAGLCGYIFLGVTDTSGLYSSMMPLTVSFTASFFVAKVMLTLWDCAATTILVCHCMLEQWYKDDYGAKKMKNATMVKTFDDDDDDEDAEHNDDEDNKKSTELELENLEVEDNENAV